MVNMTTQSVCPGTLFTMIYVMC